MFFTKTRMKFLSIFAGIFIIAAMMPASSLSFADENNAAMIDGVSYATLQAALDAADSGETVVLQKNILDERTGSETGNADDYADKVARLVASGGVERGVRRVPSQAPAREAGHRLF